MSENKNKQELNLNEMAKVTGGKLDDQRKAYLQNQIRLAKQTGYRDADLYFKNFGGTRTAEEIEYMRSVWNKIAVRIKC